jgi:hypothetical protein
MELVSGTYSNGTYLGVIVPNIQNMKNTIVKYKFYFKDNLGYYYNSEHEGYKLKTRDLSSPNIFDDSKVMICPHDAIKKYTSSSTSFDDLNCFGLTKQNQNQRRLYCLVLVYLIMVLV